MNDLAYNLNFTDKFEGAITRTLGRTFKVERSNILLPSDAEDRKLARDFAIKLNGKEVVVLARMRSLSSGGGFYNADFTMREAFKKNNSAITEMEKVFIKGYGDIFFYGISDDDYNITNFRICDVNILRQRVVYNAVNHTVRSRATGQMVGRRGENPGHDDTFFWAFPWLEMPNQFLIAGDPMPRKPTRRSEAKIEAPMFAELEPELA